MTRKSERFRNLGVLVFEGHRLQPRYKRQSATMHVFRRVDWGRAISLLPATKAQRNLQTLEDAVSGQRETPKYRNRNVFRFKKMQSGDLGKERSQRISRVPRRMHNTMNAPRRGEERGRNQSFLIFEITFRQGIAPSRIFRIYTEIDFLPADER